MAKRPVFKKKDIEILCHSISLVPTLELATYATKLSKEHLKFPIKSHEDLKPLFAIPKLHEKFCNTGITYKLTLKFLSKKFFPIENEEDFLGKIFAALLYGEKYHAFEKSEEKEKVKNLVKQLPKHEYIKYD